MAAEISRKHMFQLFVLVLIGAGIGQILQRTAPIGRDVSSSVAAQTLLQDRSSPSREAQEPTLTLVVFTDYQCPACKVAHRSMDAAVQRDGHIRIVYKDWPIFGAISQRAARIAIAADRQGIYSAVHDRLMKERRPLDTQVFREAVALSGGSWTQIESDLVTYAADIETQLEHNRQDAFKLGLSGTPAYLAGPILVSGGLNEADFARVFELGRKTLDKL
ncbi:MAG: DsbA family protein [Sphingorhabdus sp.]